LKTVRVSLNRLEDNIKMDIGLRGWEMYELHSSRFKFMILSAGKYVSY
jgi:hypothetical protein